MKGFRNFLLDKGRRVTEARKFVKRLAQRYSRQGYSVAHYNDFEKRHGFSTKTSSWIYGVSISWDHWKEDSDVDDFFEELKVYATKLYPHIKWQKGLNENGGNSLHLTFDDYFNITVRFIRFLQRIDIDIWWSVWK